MEDLDDKIRHITPSQDVFQSKIDKMEEKDRTVALALLCMMKDLSQNDMYLSIAENEQGMDEIVVFNGENRLINLTSLTKFLFGVE